MIDTVPATEYYSLLALVGAIAVLLWGFILGLGILVTWIIKARRKKEPST